ncbi:lycopene cyclase family protein [Motilibacter deserti]|uniref:FAD-binding protein n=1 Tax=Motilibacter deserti TaxID=2714956 RepID=A0ABX0GW27_9ACTN|nr:FAD-binding protein [Motilibacter deserti]
MTTQSPAVPGRERVDVLVAGAGPAGLAAAAACAREGLQVIVVDPLHAPWRPTYSLWHDEAEAAASALGLGTATTISSAFDRTLVRTARSELTLARRYAVLDNTAARQALLDAATRRGAQLVTDRLVAVSPDGTGRLASGRRIDAAVVLDATGPRPRRGAAGPAQRAWGELVEGADALVAKGEALFMDWATPKRVSADFPWFLYALDRGDGSTLLEATSLAAAPPVPLPALRAALHQLLARHALRPVGPAERVSIPLGDPPPPRRRTTVPLGAAAGLVHPATGYSVAASLLLATPLAGAVAAAVQAGDAAGARRAAERTTWPTSRRRAWPLLRLGLDVLLGLDADGLDAFFAAFFTLPEHTWAGYAAADPHPTAVTAAMRSTFIALPWRLRRDVLAACATPPGARLLVRAVTG